MQTPVPAVPAASVMCQGRVLLVDDRLESRELIADELEDLGLEVVEASDGESGWERFAEFSFDLVITDLRMPRSDGLCLLRRIRSPQSPRPQVPVVILSAFGTVTIAAEAGNAGATAFYSYDAAGIEALKDKVAELLVEPANPVPPELLGGSTASVALRGLLTAHANSFTPVLLCGEVGSGRSAAARFLHDSGRATSAPFSRVTRGAADPYDPRCAGTIYLHDFDSFSKLEQRDWYDRILEIEAQGRSARQRILASASDELGPLHAAGCLDPVLARTLSRFRIDLPPLRRRVEDLPEISRALLDRTERRLGRRGFEIDSAAMDALRKHNWYENIAELDRVLESIMAAMEDRQITHEKVRVALAHVEGPLRRIATEEAKKERALLVRLWAQKLSYTGVASELGVTRNTAKNRMAKYNLVPGCDGLARST